MLFASRVMMSTGLCGQGTAEAGTDYIESKGTLIFRPGECLAAVSVKIVEDDAFEPDETFTVHLRNAVGAQPRAIPLLDTSSPGCVSCTCLVCTVVLSRRLSRTPFESPEAFQSCCGDLSDSLNES